MVKTEKTEDLISLLELSHRFKEIYEKFVYSMENEIIDNLFIKYRLVNEGELFCSDFQFRFSD